MPYHELARRNTASQRDALTPVKLRAATFVPRRGCGRLRPLDLHRGPIFICVALSAYDQVFVAGAHGLERLSKESHSGFYQASLVRLLESDRLRPDPDQITIGVLERVRAGACMDALNIDEVLSLGGECTTTEAGLGEHPGELILRCNV